MKAKLLILFCFVSCFYVISQDTISVVSEKKLYTYQNPYLFDDFKEGVILYKDSKWLKQKLNLNILSGKIEIAADSAILEIYRGELVKMVSLSGRFYYIRNNQFCEVIFDDKKVQLVKEYNLDLVDSKYSFDPEGMVSKTGSYSYSNHFTSRKVVLCSFRTKYKYLVYFNGAFYPANKRGMKRIFSSYRRYLKRYLKYSDIDWEDENDLKKLIEYFNFVRKNYGKSLFVIDREGMNLV